MAFWQRRFATALTTALVLVGLAPRPAAAAPSSFWTGFADGIYEQSANASTWLHRTVGAGASFILLPVDWAGISPRPPARGSDPANPANPAYHWGRLDQTVRDAVGHGLTVAFTIAGGGGGPPWADGPHRPGWAQPGTWHPNAKAFSNFVKALARRYSGRFDPASGSGGLVPPLPLAGTDPLPRVRYYQPWSEPNLYDHLTPQWVRVHGQWVAESAIIYRGLLNAAYVAVKSVDGRDLVITGGTAPFGDPPSGGNSRVPPVAFLRELLCLRGSSLKPERCPNPAHFDILAHHPYSIAGPWWSAIDSDDASLPDIWKLSRVLKAAQRSGTVLPHGRKQLWVTEFSWDSDPPDRNGVPMKTWEHWLEESFYVVWHQGVDAMAWFLIQDEPCSPNCADTYQSGVYYITGRPKPGLQAFRFPFVVEHAGRGQDRVWGISPRAGTVLVQRGVPGGWRTVARFNVGAHGVFTRTMGLPGRSLMRAIVGSEKSLSWRAA